MSQTANVHIASNIPLPPPRVLAAETAPTDAQTAFVSEARQQIRAILFGRDPRFLVVVGPCSIHDPAAGLDYARRLAALARELGDRLCVVMRVYFEKPRTTVGWKGLIMDPHLDGSCDIPTGLRLARRILRDVIDLGLPTATELLDPITPQYIADLICWSAIGARTTESQTHRQMASGLSMPVGFKNGTDGGLQIAIDAMQSAMRPHSFLGIDQDGYTCIVRTTGNPDGHVVLRGGRLNTNFDAESIRIAAESLTKAGLPPTLMVDCSHANSLKQHAKQEEVWRSLIEQRVAGSKPINGVMIESNLAEGSQSIPENLAALRYGVSVTDACLGWEVTERALRWGRDMLAKAR